MIQQQAQQIWDLLRALGELVATPGIDDTTKEDINIQIRLLLKAQQPILDKISAAASGLIIK